MAWKRLMMIGVSIGLACVTGHSRQADFSPAALNDTWNYAGTLDAYGIFDHQKAVLARTMKIIGVDSTGGNRTIRVVCLDSLSGRMRAITDQGSVKLPDTVRSDTFALRDSGVAGPSDQGLVSVINTAPFWPSFMTHSSVDSVAKGTVEIHGREYPWDSLVFSPSHMPYTVLAWRAGDIGVLGMRYTNYASIMTSLNWVWDLKLTRFNSIPIDGVVVGLIPGNKHVTLGAAGSGNARDLLGRRSARRRGSFPQPRESGLRSPGGSAEGGRTGSRKANSSHPLNRLP